MFCPKCGWRQDENLKFCNQCGAALHAVREALARPASSKFDWSKTWVAEMMLSEDERKRRGLEEERARGVTPEIKRYNEIKAGVITSSVGVGVMVFLLIFMDGLIASGVPADAAQILSHVWVAGAIPFFIGLALIINGVFVSKRIVEASKRELHSARIPQAQNPTTNDLEAPADWPESPRFGVTENTTRELGRSDPTR